MKDFFERHPTLIGGIAVASIILTVILGLLLLGARELQLQTLQRIDRVASDDNLPGPQSQVSERSKRQLEVMVRENPHILAGWITQLQYGRTQDPILHGVYQYAPIEKAMKAFSTDQLAGKGVSSEDMDRRAQNFVRNSEESRSGMIKCGPITTTNIPKREPEVLDRAKLICRATIPPFDDNVNIAVVLVTDAPEGSQDLQAVRRTLVTMQIDIYNRDYQGRETWARQLGER